MNLLPPVIILAGGFGTRLRKAVPHLPKPLAPIRGVPFLRYLLAYIESQGVTSAIISTGYLGELIESELGNRFGKMALRYHREESPLGTGGALRAAMERYVPSGSAIGMNGDSYFPIPLQALGAALQDRQAVAALALKYKEPADRYGVVEIDEYQRILNFSEKGVTRSGLINGGIYWLSEEFLNITVQNRPFSLEREFLEPQAIRRNLLGIPFDCDFIDIGMPEDFMRAENIVPPMGKLLSNES